MPIISCHLAFNQERGEITRLKRYPAARRGHNRRETEAGRGWELTHLFAERRDAFVLGALETLELEAVAAVELVVALLPPAEPSRERARPAGRTFGGELPVQMQHRELGGATCHRAAGASHTALDPLDAALRLRLVAARLRAAAAAVVACAARTARSDRMRARLRLLATLALARRLAAACVGAVQSLVGALARLLLRLLQLQLRGGDRGGGLPGRSATGAGAAGCMPAGTVRTLASAIKNAPMSKKRQAREANAVRRTAGV